MSGPCRLIILNAWSPTMSASFICNVIPIIIVLMMLTILGQSSLRLSARSGQWRCCCRANAWQVNDHLQWMLGRYMPPIIIWMLGKHLGRLWINQWQALRRHDHPDGRVGELSVKGGREDDQRWGGRSFEETTMLTIEQCLSGHAVYTASWTAARADVHSQQRFFCLMEEGEVRVLHIINWGKVMRMSGTRNSPREIRIFRWPPTSATVVTPWQATPPMVSCLSIHSTSGFINNNI